MKLLHGIRIAAAMLFIVMAAAPQDVAAQDDALLQRYRSRRQKVSGGLIEMRTDAHAADSTALAEMRQALMLDSLMGRAAALELRTDSLWAALDSTATRTDSLALLKRALAADSTATEWITADSVTMSEDALPTLNPSPQPAEPDTLTRKRSFKEALFPDSSSLSRVCWTAAVLPGYGQVYNKQYWKLPVLYGLVGASVGMFVHENNKYRPLKHEYDLMTDGGLFRTEAMDDLQARMMRVNTRRQFYLGAMIASYIYFIGDAAVNYTTNDVSRVKKATTLSTICPGAGQIYNRSYWKVPFVVGGFASMIYCIDWNNRGYKRFHKAYALLAYYAANPQNYPNGPTDEFRGRYAAAFIKNLKDSYRRNRDLCIILTGALYILNIIDAHVDAHLKDYDISDDLTFNIEPMVRYDYVPALGDNRAMFGFNVSVNF